MDPRFFSLVIPCFKQEKIIKENLRRVEGVLKGMSLDYEIIIVVDGKVDKTSQIVRRLAKKNKKIKLFEHEKNYGKGYAVKFGIQKTRGDIVGFMDSGLDLDPQGISIALDYMRLHNADIVVGSKIHPDSEVNYPLYRGVISFGGRFITQFLFGFSILDTQVGLKIFKRKVAMDVFPRLLVKKFAFDIEMLAVANVLGYRRIYESPVKLTFRKGSISYGKLLRVLPKTLWDTLAIFYRIKILQYYRRSNRKNWLDPIGPN